MHDAINRNIILKFADLMGTGQIDLAGELISENVAWRSMRRKGGPVLNKAQIIAALKKVAMLMKEGVYRFWIKAMTVEGERVAAEAEGFGTLPDGSTYQQLYHMLFIMRDGKIVETKEYCDSVHTNETLIRFL